VNIKGPADIIAAVGLTLGGVFGIAGTVVTAQNLRAAFWGIDGVGIVMAAALLTLKLARKNNDCVAAGFLVFAIGEAIILSCAPVSLAAAVPLFGAGTALWSAGLLLTSIPREFAIWTRLTGIIGAVLFAITSARIFWGEQLLPTASPLPFFAYPFLVLTFAGWIWTLLRTPVSERATQHQSSTAA
jgi:hypothetical protein